MKDRADAMIALLRATNPTPVAYKTGRSDAKTFKTRHQHYAALGTKEIFTRRQLEQAGAHQVDTQAWEFGDGSRLTIDPLTDIMEATGVPVALREAA